ncbi:hypothetical protein G6F65_013908 [Rhizopus arrhizus]|nr:hypothetical protein G6F65_013908 [Rhizopus arrhizus]
MTTGWVERKALTDLPHRLQTGPSRAGSHMDRMIPQAVCPQTHGRAGLLIIGGQRAVHRSHRLDTGTARPRLVGTHDEMVLRVGLCGAGGLCRRPGGFLPQGPGDVFHQRPEGGRLPADVLLRQHRRGPGISNISRLSGLRGRGHRRRRLLARQIRHRHRNAAPPHAGQGQQLDRRPHGLLHHPGHGAGWSADLVLGVQRAAQPLVHRQPGPHARRSGHPRDRLRVSAGSAVQPDDSAHPRALSAAAKEPGEAHPHVLGLCLRALARQAGPDLAGRDHAVLGRRRDPPADRHRMGPQPPGLSAGQGLDADGRGSAGHGGRLHPGRPHPAAPRPGRAAASTCCC